MQSQNILFYSKFALRSEITPEWLLAAGHSVSTTSELQQTFSSSTKILIIDTKEVKLWQHIFMHQTHIHYMQQH